jgi:hypothetical protein
MSNKLKSLIYLSCFLLASIAYTVTEDKVEDFSHAEELAEADVIIQPFTENSDKTETK